MREFRPRMEPEELNVYTVVISHSVIREFFPSYVQYLMEDVGLSYENAHEKVQSLEEHAKSLSLLAYRFREGRIAGTREFSIPGTGWILVYRVSEEEKTVLVLTVVHELTLG